MIGRLTDSWKYTKDEIWGPLSKVKDAPKDLHIELYQTAMNYFKNQLDYRKNYDEFQNAEMVKIWNDPQTAKKAFQQIKKEEFKGELEIVAFFEEVHRVIEEDLENDVLSNRYFNLVNRFLSTHNLRYRLIRPFQLIVQLPWVYADIYRELNQINERDLHLQELMDDFEDAFDKFVRTRRKRDLRISIARASNYAEGVAATRLKVNKGNLGEMCDSLVKEQVWPHKTVQQSLKELYGFCSDYPGVRHAGNKKSKLRILNEKDTIIISALLIAYSGYISNQVDINKILSG